MSKQTFVITPKNCPRPLEVLGERAAVLASGEVGFELFLKQGSRGSTSSRHRRPSESVLTKTFSKAIHRLKEGRFQGRALLGYPRITDFADSRLAHRSVERSAQTSEADSRCCRLRGVRLAHGICVHAGHER